MATQTTTFRVIAARPIELAETARSIRSLERVGGTHPDHQTLMDLASQLDHAAHHPDRDGLSTVVLTAWEAEIAWGYGLDAARA